MSDADEPRYAISTAARMVGLHAQTLRYYEKVGLVVPSRTGGRQRLYSQRDIDILKRIKSLCEDMGLNLAGVEVVLEITKRLAEAEETVRAMGAEIYALRRRRMLPSGATDTEEGSNAEAR